MAQQVKLTSLDALEAFRADLIVFMATARDRVDEVREEVRRTRMWLESDRWVYWEGEIRRRQRALSLAEQELFSARLSNLRDDTTAQEQAVRKARRAVEEAEEKLRAVKQWVRRYDSTVEPLSKRLEALRCVVDQDLPKAVAFLVQAQTTLEAYVQMAPPPSALEGAPPPREGDAAPGSPSSP
jgi:chromosome segregation ATPase